MLLAVLSSCMVNQYDDLRITYGLFVHDKKLDDLRLLQETKKLKFSDVHMKDENQIRGFGVKVKTESKKAFNTTFQIFVPKASGQQLGAPDNVNFSVIAQEKNCELGYCFAFVRLEDGDPLGNYFIRVEVNNDTQDIMFTIVDDN